METATSELLHNQRYEKLKEILVDIYGRNIAAAYEDRFAKLIEDTLITPKKHEASERDTILITYGDHVSQAGETPLETLRTFCAAHLKNFINTLHILPHYPYTSDDGFSVSDYLSVDPRLGTWQDIQNLGKDFCLMFDGVFNHVSVSHEWFQRFLTDDPKYKDYFISHGAETDISHIVRPRTHRLLTPFETPSGTKHVWTTFSNDQVDLNYANPEVLYDIIATLLAYVRYGADLIRLDAIAFIWKELGTSSIHHVNAHALVRFMCEVLTLVAPWVWLVTETNVPHEENISYFGDGHNEAQMVYNFALPPLVVHTLQTGSALALTQWASTLRTPSDETHFFNFTASHDGIGVRGVSGILSENQIAELCERVKARGGRLSMKANSDGSESVYEMNISYFNAVTDPVAPQHRRIDQFLCSQAIALSLQGVPGIYLPSLLGSENWQAGVEKTGQNRTINREKLQLKTLERELQDPASIRKQVFDRYSRLIELRTAEPAFSPLAPQAVLDYGPSVFAVRRETLNGSAYVLALNNVTGREVTIELEEDLFDLILGQRHHHTITLAPYQTVWLKG